jgi:ubiquinone/menaquinone biosynthesis C-methylase UbiE
MSDRSKELIDERGLPRYFDMQAELGYTKHIGGSDATRELLDLCRVSCETYLLNAGCGAGTTTTYIVQHYGCRVVGVDIKPNMIQSAENWAERKRFKDKVELRVADAQDLPFEDGKFDVVISESVNVFIPDKTKAFSEYYRVLKPGGAVGINEAILTKEPPQNAAELLSDYVGSEILPGSFWVDLLQETGFKHITAREYQVEMRRESRSQVGFFSAGDYLGLLWKLLKVTFGRDPFVRNLARRSWSNPREFYEFFGYGLFAGWKE